MLFHCIFRVYTGWEAKVYERYTPKRGFKYPTRICATFVVAVICMYQVSNIYTSKEERKGEGEGGWSWRDPSQAKGMNYTY